MKYALFFLFLVSCASCENDNGISRAGNGGSSGSLGDLHPFEFIPAEADDWGEMMAEQYADSLAEIKEERRMADSMAVADSLDEIDYNIWIDSIAQDYYRRGGEKKGVNK